MRALASSLGIERLAAIVPWLGQFLPSQADPDMALNNLERFLAHPAAREQIPVGIRRNVAFASLYFLVPIVTASPPFCVVLTL